MEKVTQTKTSHIDGNCYAACIASIFGVPLELLPQPTPEHMKSNDAWADYFAQLDVEFFQPRNLTQVVISAQAGFTPAGYSIATMQMEQGDILHSCVAFDGEIVWNPHPNRDFHEFLGVYDWTVFQVLDPTKPVNQGA